MERQNCLMMWQLYYIMCQLYYIICKLYYMMSQLYYMMCQLYYIMCQLYYMMCQLYYIMCQLYYMMCQLDYIMCQLSTTKETHQSLLGAIIEIRVRKWKYIYTIFRSNQFCISPLNNVTVLLKSVHAIRQCLDKGHFQKWQVFHLRMNFSFSSKSVHLS